MALTFDETLAMLRGIAAHQEPAPVADAAPPAIAVDSRDILPIASALYRDPGTYFDMLSCVTGIDNGPAAGTIDIIYTLTSIPYGTQLMLKTTVARDAAHIQSVTPVWRTANWHEREIFDLVGVVFDGHPDLRRILLPADWEGHPLRKDYRNAEYYKNIKVDY